MEGKARPLPCFYRSVEDKMSSIDGIKDELSILSLPIAYLQSIVEFSHQW